MNTKHVKAYRKRVRRKNPQKHLLNKLKDRVRKRKKLYASYTLEKKITRITQRVIYKLYAILENEDTQFDFPEICQDPNCYYYLYEDEIAFFESYYNENPNERSSRWQNACLGRYLLSYDFKDIMKKLKTMKEECVM